MADTPTKSALNKKKVAELRGELTELGLATNGIKADLVQVTRRVLAFDIETFTSVIILAFV